MGLKLVGELGLDGSGFASGLKKAESLAAGAGHGIRNALIGLVGIGTIELAIQKTVESAKELGVACERLGIGSTQLQVLRKAAKDAGVEFEKVEKTLEAIDVMRRKSLTPGQEGAGSRRAAAQMGITPEMLRSQTASQLLMGPLSAKAKGTNEEVFGALLKELLPGIKGIGALIPVLKIHFGELEAHMKRFGAIMDAETIVKLKHVGDEFDLIQKIIVGTLGPALVAFADWLLAMASNKDSFLSRVLEGASYKRREAMGLAKLPEGAKDAHDMAIAALETIQTTNQRKTTPEQFRAQWEDYYTKGLGHDRNPERAGFFNGDKSNTWTQELQYLNSKIQPVADVRSDAAKGAEADMQAIRDSIAENAAKMKAEAERLKNGTLPPPGGFTGDTMHRTAKSLEVPSDSLTRVGNFLGGSQNAIMRLAQQRTQYLQRIAQGMDRLSGRGPARGGMANPNAVFVPTH
jgi:hypothetical protein